MRSKKPFSAGKSTFVIFITLLLASAIVPTQAQARKFKVLHTFHGRDGGGPMGVLVRDSAGNIYGTAGGGTGKCSKFGCGTVFKLDKVGKEVWLHSFGGGNGRQPMAGLLRDAAGNLYGTTVFGGTMTPACGGAQGFGCGVVFKLDKTGKETVLYKFKGTPDGLAPEALLVGDKSGNLYGTTYQGGDHTLGAVFKIDKNGRETILHSFAGPIDGGGDGAFSYEGVIQDAAGNLYGVTDAGGANCCGVVYKVDTTGKETLLYSFTGFSDGDGPDSVLVADAAGNLYGTTRVGGNSGCTGGGGCGVVFELSAHSDGSWTESVLYTFCSLPNCADGAQPLTGPLVRDSSGNLYGTTYFGGANHNCDVDGCGAVFKLDTKGDETVLHSFTGGADGEFPYAGLTMDSHGNLYGTTQGGGAICYTSFTCGVVFKITP
jgi:uncharacterized repeat protein (TIGR03803 family)